MRDIKVSKNIWNHSLIKLINWKPLIGNTESNLKLINLNHLKSKRFMDFTKKSLNSYLKKLHSL
jgi:hypothetical protein